MTTSRPRGVPTRKELGLRIAQSSVTAQSQLVGNLRPRQDRRNQVSPWLPRDPRETQTAGQGDRRVPGPRGPLEQTPGLSGRACSLICVVTEQAGRHVVRKPREEADSSWGRKIIINDGFY